MSSEAKSDKIWAWAKWLLRVAVSAALLGVVLVTTDVGRLGILAARVHWGWWVFGLALTMIAPLATAHRSRLLIRGFGRHVSLRSVVAVNLEAIFFGLVLPGELIAGVVRWGRFSRYTDRVSALALLAVERLIDWLMLAAVTAAGASLLFSGPSAPRLRFYAGVLAGVLATASGGLLLASRSTLPERAVRVLGLRLGRLIGQWSERLERLATAGRILIADSRRFLAAVLWTAVFWFLYCAGCTAMARAVMPQLPLLPYLAATAALLLLTQVPLTVAGVGLRELSLPLLLGAYGVDRELGLLLGMNVFLSYVLLGLAGLFVHLSGRAQLAEASAAEESP